MRPARTTTRRNACSMYPRVYFADSARRHVTCLISRFAQAPKDSHASAERRLGSPNDTIWRGTILVYYTRCAAPNCAWSASGRTDHAQRRAHHCTTAMRAPSDTDRCLPPRVAQYLESRRGSGPNGRHSNEMSGARAASAAISSSVGLNSSPETSISSSPAAFVAAAVSSHTSI